MTRNEFLEKNKVPKKYLTARLEDAPKGLDIRISQSYFFFGLPGTGKTHLAWAILIEKMIADYAAGRKSEVAFTTVGKLLLRLRDTMNRGHEEKHESEWDIFKKYSETELLVLDDLGGMRPTEATRYTLDNVFEILNERIANERQTIITSNLTLKELAIVFDPRIPSRIGGMCQLVNLGGSDRRLIKNGETFQKNAFVGQKEMPLTPDEHDSKWLEITGEKNTKGYGYKLPWPTEKELEKDIAGAKCRKAEAEVEAKRQCEERNRKAEEWKRKEEEISRIAREKLKFESTPEYQEAKRKEVEATRQKLLKQAEEYTAQQNIQKPPEADNEPRKK
jgi:hypothetical protein